MSDEVRRFEDLSDEEKATIIARGRAQFAPLRTPGVIAQTAEATPPLPEPTGSRAAQIYGAAAKGAAGALTSILNPAVHFATEPLVRLTRMAQEQSLKPLTDRESPVESARPLTRGIADLAIPQTPLQAGLLVGTGAAGALARGASPAVGALARIAGGAIGGEAGNQLEGGQTGKGVAVGAGGALLGEGLGGGAAKLARSTAGAKTRVAGDDAADLGRQLAEFSPALGGAKTGLELNRMAAGGGKKALGDAKEAVVKDIEGALGGQTISVPSLSADPMTFREANKKLSEIGANAFSKNILNRNINGVDQRRLWGTATQEITDELKRLSPAGRQNGLDEMFTAAQTDYKKGITLLKSILEEKGSFRTGQNGVELNLPRIQARLIDPKTQATLRNKLGDEGFDQLVNTLTRGGGLGTQDILAMGQGRIGEPVRQALTGRNTGSSALVTAPLTGFLPNVGSSYAGRAPYAPSNAAQTLMDLLAQQAGLNVMRDE